MEALLAAELVHQMQILQVAPILQVLTVVAALEQEEAEVLPLVAMVLPALSMAQVL
jgi:hypothetical protein